MRVVIRTNGRGNAWPLELGVKNPGNRYQELRHCACEYANTSLSILGYEKNGEAVPKWEVLFDIGQGIVPFLIQNGNRLPHAVLLSHPHFDHYSGLDWLCNSFDRNNGNHNSKLHVYTTLPCWQEVMKRFSWLENKIEPHFLKFGKQVLVVGAKGLHITAFPVYHGPYAHGACLILAEYGGERAILSGDLLCPLIAEGDWVKLQGAKVAYVDANTRFPWSESGHWSIIEKNDDGEEVIDSERRGSVSDWIKIN